MDAQLGLTAPGIRSDNWARGIPQGGGEAVQGYTVGAFLEGPRPVAPRNCARLQGMNPEVISIVSVGVAIIGTLIVFFRWIRQDIRDLRQEVRQEMRDVRREMREMENRLNARIDALLSRPGTAA